MAYDSKDAQDILKQALEDYQSAYEYARGNIDEAMEDLKFRRGRKEDQWDATALAVRGDRPCLVINGIPQFIRQVTGDMRQMRPSIKVSPVDDRGDKDTSEVAAGLIRHIENRSNAKQIYTAAGDSQVACGIGHFQITSEYGPDMVNQELRILGVDDQVQILWDPDAVTPTREDAMFCHVPTDMSRARFKKRWPDAKVDEYAFEMANSEGWYTGDCVRVSSYWVKHPIKRTLVIMPDGGIDDITDQIADAPEDVLAGAEQFYASRGAKLEKRDSFRVCRYLITASEVLEKIDWPGMHIPIVPLIGEEVRIGKEIYRHGVVRYARDPQKMVNYYASADAETIALQPKAPYMATRKQIEKDLPMWQTANTTNHPVLIYTPDPAAPGAPQRIAPPVASPAIQLGKTQALEDMKRVIGIYDAGLGQRSNETSGVAINARDRQSDTGTFVYIDNFSVAIQRAGQIILDLIPHIYDTQRTVRIIGADGAENLAQINKPVIEDGVEKVLNDLTVSAYDVTLEPGPSYATKRQEARENMKEFIRAVPNAGVVAGDIFAKMQDWPYADEFGDRMKFLMPPELRAELKKKEEQDNPEPAEPSPQEQAAAQDQAMAGEAKQAQFAAGMEEMKAKVLQEQAKVRQAEAQAMKAEAEAEEAKYKLAITKAQWANTHMENLRTIEDHERGKEREDEDHATESRRGEERHKADIDSRTAEPVQ